jgi:hypothetical protein
VDLRTWPHQHTLRQFENTLSPDTLFKLEAGLPRHTHHCLLLPSESPRFTSWMRRKGVIQPSFVS